MKRLRGSILRKEKQDAAIINNTNDRRKEKQLRKREAAPGLRKILMFLVVSVTVSLAWHERRATGQRTSKPSQAGP